MKCYPASVQFTAKSSAKYSLQRMLYYAASRIINMIGLSKSYKAEMDGILFVKIGFDRASSQSIYNQTF